MTARQFEGPVFTLVLTTWTLEDEREHVKTVQYAMELHVPVETIAGIHKDGRQRAEQYCEAVMRELDTLMCVISTSDPRWFGDVLGEDVTSNVELVNRLRSAMYDNIALPRIKDLTRANFLDIQSRQQWRMRPDPVGMRCYLAVTKDGVFVVTKAGRFFRAPALEYLRMTMGGDEKLPVVMEGKLVRNRGASFVYTKWTPIFYAVDVVRHGTEDLRGKSLGERMQTIGEFQKRVAGDQCEVLAATYIDKQNLK